MKIRRLLTGCAAVALLAACTPSTDETAATPSTGHAPRTPAVTPAAEPASVEFPTLQVTTIDGTAFDLADHRGKWVVVNFWATWCAPCLKEMPELSALDAMRDHIEVIGLSYEETDTAEMQAFLAKRPVVYPIAILDTYDPPADFDTPKGLPMTYLIAPDGRVAEKFLGPVTAEGIETMIAEAGGPAPVGS